MAASAVARDRSSTPKHNRYVSDSGRIQLQYLGPLFLLALFHMDDAIPACFPMRQAKGDISVNYTNFVFSHLAA
jgi:hypothetical protein